MAPSFVDVGTYAGVHEPLDESRVGLIDQTARLGGDRGEDERALARARYAGEHRQPALRDDDVDTAQVVLTSADDANDVVRIDRVLSSSPSSSHTDDCA